MQPPTTRSRAPGSARLARATAWFVVLLPLVGWAAGLPAAGSHPAMAWRVAEERKQNLSMDRAVELAEQRYRARVVRAATSEAQGRRVYVLKLLSNEGRVWTVHVDAETGAMN